MRFNALVAILALASAPSTAAITDIFLFGHGRVTYSSPGDIYGQPVYGPPAGKPVDVALAIHIGGFDYTTGLPVAPPDGFTGRFTFDYNRLENGTEYFAWNVFGGSSWANSMFSNAYEDGWIDFVNGRVTALELFTDSDPEVNRISLDGWRYAAGSGGWGGTWTVVPEPATWGMFVAGFGLAGAALRKRRIAHA